MSEAGEHALEGSIEASVAPAACNLHKGIGETADGGIHCVLHALRFLHEGLGIGDGSLFSRGERSVFILCQACIRLEHLHINGCSLIDTACHGLFGPFACGVGIYLHDAHAHAELERVGQAPVALNEVGIIARQAAAARLVVHQDIVEQRALIPLRLLLEMLQTCHDGVEIADDAFVDGLQVIIGGRAFQVHLVFQIGEGA